MSLALLLALVLPLLIGLLPPLAPTAAYALQRDIAASLCVTGENGGQPAHQDHQQCCILCPAGASFASTPDKPHLPPPRAASGASHHFATGVVLIIRPAKTGHSARGPPAPEHE